MFSNRYLPVKGTLVTRPLTLLVDGISFTVFPEDIKFLYLQNLLAKYVVSIEINV